MSRIFPPGEVAVADITGYTVAVRSLCEFTAKTGDLDLRFTPSPTAQEGIAGHKLVTGRRPDGYQAEITLRGQYRSLHVRGRADGYDPQANQLEEIKTFRGDLSRMPDNHRQLHWAQAKIYGWLLCEARSLTELSVALVYFDIGSGDETVLTEVHHAATLQAFFEDHCARFLHWAEQELLHRTARDAALVLLPFPHGEFRSGQRPLAEAVFRAGNSGRCLLAQAPTGIGKTIGTIFPALKAMPGQRIDKLFFLTAKTSGRQVALDTAQRIRQAAPSLPLRVIEIVARERACEYPDRACHGDACPLAEGFYDRLPGARAEAVALAGGPTTESKSHQAASPNPGLPLLDRATVRDIALAHAICPYYLTQELVRWADVIVADYNYYFDYSAMLYALAQADDWRVTILADEAHNLVERARRMYSATLDEHALLALSHAAPSVLRAPLAALARQWETIGPAPAESYVVLPAVPGGLRSALQALLAAMSDYFSERPGNEQPALLAYFFEALHFSRLIEAFGPHSIVDVTRETALDGTLITAGDALAAKPADPFAGSLFPIAAGQPNRQLCLRNLVPATFLRPRMTGARSVTLFSATLSPEQFYRDMLGLPDDTVWVDVPSPFLADQLSVQIVDRISTRFGDRRRSLRPIVNLMARQYHRQPGNYLAFFSSFSYLQQVSLLFAECHPDIPMWEQSRRMDDAARQAFLAHFRPGNTGIGFAVLGGSFAEGIDLPGERLIGAFIATLGLPQLNPINEQMMERMEAIFGAGYDYTYLYPGIQKVVQAAGRVIRTQTDQGVVFLIDDRFARSQVRALLPRWWHVAGESPAMPSGATSEARTAIPIPDSGSSCARCRTDQEGRLP